MRHLDLFSGIGGFALAARWAGWETVGFCEIDPWCQRVLAKNFPGVPIHDDVQTIMADTRCDEARSGEELDRQAFKRGQRSVNFGNGSQRPVHFGGSGCIITGGFPCQPYSLAGKRGGQSDDRALGHEFVRLVDECGPEWAVGENVYGFVSMGLEQMLLDLEGLGYRVQTFVIPACAVDAPHRRDRVWIVAHQDRETLRPEQVTQQGRSGAAEPREHGSVGPTPHADRETKPTGTVDAEASGELAMADTGSARLSKRKSKSGVHGQEECRKQGQKPSLDRTGAIWLPEPGVGRVANGVPRRVDRLRGLGNSIVPQVAYELFEAINASD